jgi:hypothetical protein
MNIDLYNQLKEKYQQQFCQLKYIGCGDGWYDLLDKLCNTIQNRIDFNLRNDIKTDFYWSQIKEKFGGLRAYCYGADEYMTGAISMAETMSCSICEYSGEKGKMRNKKIGENGESKLAWIKTLCDNEAAKEGYF